MCLGPVGTAVVRDNDFPGNARFMEGPRCLSDTHRDRFRLVQAGHDDRHLDLDHRLVCRKRWSCGVRMKRHVRGPRVPIWMGIGIHNVQPASVNRRNRAPEDAANAFTATSVLAVGRSAGAVFNGRPAASLTLHSIASPPRPYRSPQRSSRPVGGCRVGGCRVGGCRVGGRVGGRGVGGRGLRAARSM